MGVEELTEGRLRAAGSMSGILEVFSRNGGVGCTQMDLESYTARFGLILRSHLKGRRQTSLAIFFDGQN